MSNKSKIGIVLEKNISEKAIIQPHIIKINNLRCVLVNYPCSNVVSAGFFVKIGSAYESIEERGISHFLEHMLFPLVYKELVPFLEHGLI
jgi:secreted Zn-dependent insulinase-like peptidase